MANDSWRTPPEVFAALNDEFNFVFDLAASHENALCINYFTEEDDALSQDWAALTHGFGKAWLWLNPPYSNPLPFVQKAVEEQRKGAGIVMLVNDDMSVRWSYEALRTVSEIRHITAYVDVMGGFHNGRLAFLDDEGNPCNQNSKGQVILVFDPHRIGAQHTSYVTKFHLMNAGAAIMANRARKWLKEAS